MKKLIFWTLSCLLPLIVVTGCSRNFVAEDIPQPVKESESPMSDGAYNPGVMKVRLTPEFATVVEGNTAEDGTVQTKSVKSMSYALEDLGIVSMTRLFPEAGRFEERTRAAGLHLWYVVTFDESKSLTKAFNDLRDIPGVDYVEPDAKVAITGGTEVTEYVAAPDAAADWASVFDDPLLSTQWHYYNDGSSKGTQSGCDINVLPVWKGITTGDSKVVVAVVDEGVDYEHEDLAANIWEDPEHSGGHGYNFASNTYKINRGSHGTHVAGTIAAVNNNGKGVCGIAGGNFKAGKSGVRIMSCQIFDGDRSGSGEAAIKWGADHGAVISQNSWGYVDVKGTPESLKAAVDYFEQYAGKDEKGKQVGPMDGGVVIFSAGNEDRNWSANMYEKMISVGALAPDYYRAYYSCYGDWVKICAPGGDFRKGSQIVSTLPGNKYGKMQGTSMACPHVSGVAALIASKNGGPGFTNTQLKKLLLEHTTDVSSYNRNYPVGGLVNAFASLNVQGGKAPNPVKEYSLSAKSNNVTCTITIPSAQSGGQPVNSLIVYFTDNPKNEPIFTQFYVGDQAAGQTFTGTVIGLKFETEYTFEIVACDLAGNKSAKSAAKKITTGSNTKPFITPESPTTLTLRAYQKGEIKFKYGDEDGHRVLIDLLSDPYGADAEYLDTLDFNKPRVTVDASKVPSGTYKSVIRVKDYYELSNQLEFTYTVLPNTPPKIVKTIPDMIFTKRGDEAQIKAAEYFADEDEESLDYTISSSDESIANVNYSNGIFYVTSMGYGITDVTVKASDARKASVSQTFKILVRDGNKECEMYPNPVKKDLFIRTGVETSATVSVVSATGAEVYYGEVKITPFEPAKVSMADCSAGVYTVVVTCGDKEYKSNIVKI